jgi:hypothetical protein
MRNGQTYFEQVPMDEVVEIVLRQIAAPETMLERSPAPPEAQESQTVTVILKLRERRHFKGQL